MRDHERDDEKTLAMAKRTKVNNALERLEPGRMSQGGAEQQRAEHDQKAERQERRPRPPAHSRSIPDAAEPVPRLDHAIGAIETDPQALDSAGSKINSEHSAQRQRARAR